MRVRNGPGAINIDGSIAACRKFLTKSKKISAAIGGGEAYLITDLEGYIYDKIDPDKL